MRTTNATRGPKYSQERRWPRYDVEVPVRVLTQTWAKNVIVNGHGRDLNAGGMRVFALLDFSIGERVAIEFTPPFSGRLIRICCIVRYRNGHTYGIEFITENSSDSSNVAQLESSFEALGASGQ